MKKATRLLSGAQKEFHDLFKGLCDSHNSWEVWGDFVRMSAIAISNACDQSGEIHDQREARYMETMKRYSAREQEVFPKMFSIIVNTLEINPDQDFLGELFMTLELSNQWKGQFFTPYNLCKCMAEMQIGESEEAIKKKSYIAINDPACGAGALLIAARNTLGLRKIDWSTQALFVAQDIDEIAGLMCYIQLSLLGCAGYVCVADSLLYPITGTSPLLPLIKPEQDFWFTPVWFTDTWAIRRFLATLPEAPAREAEETPIITDTHKKTVTEATETAFDFKLTENECGQYSLF